MRNGRKVNGKTGKGKEEAWRGWIGERGYENIAARTSNHMILTTTILPVPLPTHTIMTYVHFHKYTYVTLDTLHKHIQHNIYLACCWGFGFHRVRHRRTQHLQVKQMK